MPNHPSPSTHHGQGDPGQVGIHDHCHDPRSSTPSAPLGRSRSPGHVTRGASRAVLARRRQCRGIESPVPVGLPTSSPTRVRIIDRSDRRPRMGIGWVAISLVTEPPPPCSRSLPRSSPRRTRGRRPGLCGFLLGWAGWRRDVVGTGVHDTARGTARPCLRRRPGRSPVERTGGSSAGRHAHRGRSPHPSAGRRSRQRGGVD